MKIHFKGKYNMDPDSLPNRPHRPGAQMFKEIGDIQTLGRQMNKIALIMMVVLVVCYVLRVGKSVLMEQSDQVFAAAICSMLVLLPHEFLHAICFREDTYIYTALRQGLLFVFGPEDMTKRRFVFMSLLPNLVFGIIPFVIGMIWPEKVFFGVLGVLSIPAGVGDYYNIRNALQQVPKGGLIYMYGFHSYWYLPKEVTE